MSEDSSVAVALAELRGAVDTGFARIDGRLDGYAQRTDGLEHRVEVLEETARTLAEATRKDMEGVKGRIWQLCTIVALLSSGSAAGLTRLISG